MGPVDSVEVDRCVDQGGVNVYVCTETQSRTQGSGSVYRAQLFFIWGMSGSVLGHLPYFTLILAITLWSGAWHTRTHHALVRMRKLRAWETFAF